jgi:hypothetical protein
MVSGVASVATVALSATKKTHVDVRACGKARWSVASERRHTGVSGKHKRMQFVITSETKACTCAMLGGVRHTRMSRYID